MKRVKVSNNVIRRLPRYLRKLDELSEFLYEKETITGDEFMEILKH